jgi:galactose mutarotase-like enzyme
MDQRTPLETLELRDPSGGSRVLLAPERGGLVTRFSVAGRELLYLDEATLLDPGKNVRGGVPVLFPAAGKLSGGRWQRGARGGALGQHGFARNLPWAVVDRSAAEATLRLASTQATLAAFPWEFELTFRFSLRGPVLRIDQRYKNCSSDPLPFSCGFHPYFLVPQAAKAAARVETRATRAFDNTRQLEVPLAGPIDLTAAEVDLHLEDHGGSSAALQLPDGRIELRGSEQLWRWVIWTLAGKEFVCLEPWSAPGDALNSGRTLLHAPPGGAVELWSEIGWRA